MNSQTEKKKKQFLLRIKFWIILYSYEIDDFIRFMVATTFRQPSYNNRVVFVVGTEKCLDDLANV